MALVQPQQTFTSLQDLFAAWKDIPLPQAPKDTIPILPPPTPSLIPPLSKPLYTISPPTTYQQVLQLNQHIIPFFSPILTTDSKEELSHSGSESESESESDYDSETVSSESDSDLDSESESETEPELLQPEQKPVLQHELTHQVETFFQEDKEQNKVNEDEWYFPISFTDSESLRTVISSFIQEEEEKEKKQHDCDECEPFIEFVDLFGPHPPGLFDNVSDASIKQEEPPLQYGLFNNSPPCLDDDDEDDVEDEKKESTPVDYFYDVVEDFSNFEPNECAVQENEKPVLPPPTPPKAKKLFHSLYTGKNGRTFRELYKCLIPYEGTQVEIPRGRYVELFQRIEANLSTLASPLIGKFTEVFAYQGGTGRGPMCFAEYFGLKLFKLHLHESDSNLRYVTSHCFQLFGESYEKRLNQKLFLRHMPERIEQQVLFISSAAMSKRAKDNLIKIILNSPNLVLIIMICSNKHEYDSFFVPLTASWGKTPASNSIQASQTSVVTGFALSIKK